MACAFVGVSALLMLLELVQALTTWGTIEMQKALQPTLSGLHERGVDMSMAELLGTLRWIALGGVVLVIAGLVFAAYAIRGDRFSRIGLTVVAVILAVLVLSLGWVGVLQSVFLLLAAATVWTPDARAWYATQGVSAEASAAGGSPILPAAVNVPAPPPRRTAPRPRSILMAGLVTVIGSSLVGGFSVLYLVVYGFARDEYVRIVRDGPFAGQFQPGEIDDALRIAFWICWAMVPLAAAGLAAGLSLLARLPVGRVATLVLAWITAAAGVLLVPFGLLGTGAAVAVIVLLNRDESRSWTADAR
jgi:hypothetical protein